MKHFKLYITLLSSLLLAACSHEEEPSPTPGGEDASVTVSVSVDGVAATKATANSYLENAIQNMTVIFIDKQNNEVIGHGYCEVSSGGNNNEYTSESISLKTGTYRMLVMANTAEISSFKATDYYDYISADFFQPNDMILVNSWGFPMSYVDEDITINNKETTITAKVKRVVSRIELSKLSVYWNDPDLKAISGLKFKLKRVFVANVRQRTYLFDTSTWLPEGVATHPIECVEDKYYCGIEDLGLIVEGGDIAKGNVNESAVPNFPFMGDGMGTNFTNELIGKGEDATHLEDANFYVTTNSNTKDDAAPVILYITGDLYDSVNDKTVLSDRYYRVKLEKGVKPNTVYKLSAHITGKGSSAPGVNQENTDLSVTLNIQSWDGKDLDKITIDEDFEL
ncbi:fimbrial protein [Parabacteroides faecis]|uniref:fimbrial protein n=1 Tax=Parabacteroides faecis TaxID=1217282 RepID=UPI00216441F3|nr:fimbrial protein [Parabacteroides faecis]MCS2893415.1 fimbrial protein [Parabacteroides faecis]UVQ47976.1 fimbrial protein [Parabacteroides faecis]